MTLKREFGARLCPGYAQGLAQGCHFRNYLIPKDMPRVPGVPSVYARARVGVRAPASFPDPFCGMGVCAPHGREDITHGTPGTLGIFFFFQSLTSIQTLGDTPGIPRAWLFCVVPRQTFPFW